MLKACVIIVGVIFGGCILLMLGIVLILAIKVYIENFFDEKTIFGKILAFLGVIYLTSFLGVIVFGIIKLFER